MRLSKTAYYADFVIYVLLATATILWGFTHLASSIRWKAIIAAVAGCAVWTLAEYLIHRFVFHGFSPTAALHARHHAEPRAYIGTPTWVSAAIIVGFVFIPTWRIFSLPIAAGFSAGFVVGFLWYGISHHLIHHRALRWAPLLGAAVKRHYRHHGSYGVGNFGLTTEVWDRVFHTRVPSVAASSTRVCTEARTRVVPRRRQSDVTSTSRDRIAE